MERTEQETFWAGEFGTAYSDRNSGAPLLASRTAMLARMLARCRGVDSVLELGANIGLNLHALRRLLPHALLAGVEINEYAFRQLKDIPSITAINASLLGYRHEPQVDFAFTSGVLIHISPDRIEDAYAALVESSRRYVAIAEYYSPTPVEIPYRGHSGKLFKRDFAGEMMQLHRLKLVDYGFMYHGDPAFPADDITWFLMEKIT